MIGILPFSKRTDDIRYEGMFIPKGAMVVLSQWSLQFNDQIFEDPWRYDPKRYLGRRGQKTAFEALNASDPEDRDHWGYGAGRRWCPGTPTSNPSMHELTYSGIHVAEKSLFINIARIMWGFDISQPADGPDDWEVYDAEEGGFSIPKQGKFIIRPRSAQHEKVLREEWERTRKEGLHYSPAPREVFTKRTNL